MHRCIPGGTGYLAAQEEVTAIAAGRSQGVLLIENDVFVYRIGFDEGQGGGQQSESALWIPRTLHVCIP